MGKAQITLTLQQLFIADHGIRERLKRHGISQMDREAEEEALDAINEGIHEILRCARDGGYSNEKIKLCGGKKND